ncbi:beta/gamma crystallin-related protein [Acrocarpospora catenulata]|uniref:beta/gamma crystallin-related protein n=1 Tax=Acrocarpospora catenulata TaxID=2836182 RepID=UPI001BD9F9C7|nr:beta/gamma crystallin-related protein [Acrocarpospora catenulata]
MSRTTRILLSMATAVAATLGAAGTATPARAEIAGLWVYTDSWFEGYEAVHIVNAPNLSSSWSDKYSSIRNTDNAAWVLYDDKWYEDRHFCIRPGESVEYLGASRWKFNDKTSSVRKLPTRSCEGYPAFYSIG